MLIAQETVEAAAEVAEAAVEAVAEVAAASVELTTQDNLNITWTLVAAILVFFMQPGFAMLEAGFTRAKNAVNILMKNLMDFSVGAIAFYLVGFGLMFGATTNGWWGTSHFAPSEIPAEDSSLGLTFLIFQTVFAATAATIVSGAMAERIKFSSYLIYSFFITIFIYPIFGSWAWGSLFQGDGWLENFGPGFYDFAGSTVVHSVGGWLALAGAIVAGPRLGKYGPNGKVNAIPGHNIPLGALGVFILWFGWFGFNAGSQTEGVSAIGYIAVTTNLSAAAGAIAAMVTVWIVLKSADASMSLNGALAGLVGITAGCDAVTPLSAIIIGAVAGVLVVLSILFIDSVLKVDDPVGAISVHGVCGAWGTLAVGLFMKDGGGLLTGGGATQLGAQAVGVLAGFIWAFGTGLILFFAIKATAGLRVSEDEERRGLDIGEHGMEAYSGFQIFTTE